MPSFSTRSASLSWRTRPPWSEAAAASRKRPPVTSRCRAETSPAPKVWHRTTATRRVHRPDPIWCSTTKGAEASVQPTSGRVSSAQVGYYYTVGENETLPEVVAQACPQWSVVRVRDHAKNAHLFQTRNEYMLKTGDQIWIPEEQPDRKWFRLAAGKTYRFIVATPRRPFCVQLNTVQGKPLSNEPYELEVDGVKLMGTTDSEGYVRAEIPIEGTRGRITAKGLSKDLLIGGLEPVTTNKGIQARLANLSYSVGPIDGVIGRRTIIAIEAFQDFAGLKVDGIVGPNTRAALLEHHGC